MAESKKQYIKITGNRKKHSILKDKKWLNAFSVADRNPVYIHNSPTNFFNTYNEIVQQKIFDEMVNKQKKEADKVLSDFIKKSDRTAKNAGYNSLKDMTAEMNKIAGTIWKWIITPRSFAFNGRKAEEVDFKEIKSFLDNWSERAKKFEQEVQKALEELSKVEKQQATYRSYEKKFKLLQTTYQKYQELMNQDTQEGYKKAFDLITEFYAEHKKWEGWVYEVLFAKELSNQTMQILADKIINLDDIDIIGKENKLTDIKITLWMASVWINLKINDTSYVIKRAMSFDLKNITKIIRYYYYLYYNVSLLSWVKSGKEMSQILQFVTKIFLYEALISIFAWERNSEGKYELPEYIVFQNTFIPSYEIFQKYLKRADKNQLSFVKIQKPDLEVSLQSLLEDKMKALEEDVDMGYERLYDKIKPSLPLINRSSVEYSFTIEKGRVNNKNAK